MIRLSGPLQTLQAVLGGAVSSTQPDVVVSYADAGNKDRAEFEPGTKVTAMNGANGVDICDAPDAATVREIDFVSIRNNDSASVTVTVRLNNNGTSYKLIVVTLATLEHLYYSHIAGWYVVGARGQLKTSVTGLFDLSASTAGQIKFPATQNASTDVNTLDDYEEYPPTSATPVGGSGSFTTVAGLVSYTKTGNRVDYTVTVTITTNGTAATYVEVPLPFTAAEASAGAGINTTTAVVLGVIVTANGKLRMYSAAGGYPGADATTLVASGTCRV